MGVLGVSAILGPFVLLAEADHAVAQPTQLADAVKRDGRGFLLVDHHQIHILQPVVAYYRGGVYLNDFLLCHSLILQ